MWSRRFKKVLVVSKRLKYTIRFWLRICIFVLLSFPALNKYYGYSFLGSLNGLKVFTKSIINFLLDYLGFYSLLFFQFFLLYLLFKWF